MTIESKINNMKIGATDDQVEVLVKLQDQLSHSANARWTEEDLKELIFSDSDVLTHYKDEEDYFFAEVREIQHEICSEFAA